MSYQLKRITTVPGTPVVISVTDRRHEEKDAGLAAGGQFVFPVGGDPQDVNDHACKAIMGDPGTAKHFECTPPWRSAQPAPETAPVSDKRRRRGNRAESPPED